MWVVHKVCSTACARAHAFQAAARTAKQRVCESHAAIRATAVRTTMSMIDRRQHNAGMAELFVCFIEDQVASYSVAPGKASYHSK
eukprot:5468388-Pleurochrysis_carterae.AAC.5